MASFVEKATLIVEDQATPTLKKINAELQKLLDKAAKLNGTSAGKVSKAMSQLGGSTAKTRKEVEGVGKASTALVTTERRTKAARDEMGRFADETKKAGKAVRDLGVSPQTVRRVRQLRDDTQATAKAAEQAARARARFVEQLGRTTRTQSADQSNAAQTAQQIANALRNGGLDAARQITDASRAVGTQGQQAATAITQATQSIGTQGQTAAAAITQASGTIATNGQQAATAITDAMARSLRLAQQARGLQTLLPGRAADPDVADRIAQGILTGRDPLDYTPALPPPVAPGTPPAPQPPGSRALADAGAAAFGGRVAGQLSADATRATVKQITDNANDSARETARLIADATSAANARVAQVANQSPADARRALQTIKDNDDRQTEAKKLGTVAVNLSRDKQKVANAGAEVERAEERVARAREAERIADNQLRNHSAEDRLQRKYRDTLADASKKREQAEDRLVAAREGLAVATERQAVRERLLEQRATTNASNEAKRQIASRASQAASLPSPGFQAPGIGGPGGPTGPTATPLRPAAPTGGGAGGIPPGGPGGPGGPRGGGAGPGAGAGAGGAGGAGQGGGGGGWQPPTIREAARHMLPYFVAGGVLSAGRNTLQTAGEGIIYAQNQRELTSIQNLRPEALSAITQATDKLGTEFKQLSRAQVGEMTRDAINASKTPEDGAKIAAEMAKNAANLTLLYGTAEKGMEASRQFYRAADISGDSDNADSASVFMRALTKETLRSGKDINAKSVAQAIANLGTAKFGMNEDSIASVVALSDNVRGQTSAYIRQFHEYLTSNSIKDENFAAQQKAGLRGQDGGVTNERLFQEDKFEYVMQMIKPEVERRIGKPLDSFTKTIKSKDAAGRDIERVVADDAAKAAAIDKALASMGLKPSSQKLPSEYLMNEDRERKRRRDYQRVNLDGASTLANRNIQQAGQAIKSKFQDVADYWTSKVQGPLAATGGFIAKALNAIVPESKPAAAGVAPAPQQRGSLDATRFAAGTAALGAGLAVKYIIENPDKAAMMAAGVTLGTAGVSLNAAAAALSGAAVAQRAGGLAGAAGAAGAGGAAAAGTLLGRAAAVAFRGGVLGIGAAIAYDLVRTIADGTKADDRKPGDNAPRFADGTRSTVPNNALPELYGPPKPGSVLDQMMGPARPSDYARRLDGEGFTLRERRDAYRELIEMDRGGQRPDGTFTGGEIDRQRNRLDPPTSVPSVGLDSAAIGASITTSVQAVAPTLTSAMSEGGNQAAPSLTAALVNGASQAGATIAAAMRDAVSNISVSVTGGRGSSSTGTNPQAAR